MMKFYGIKNCDTVKKALKWLAANNIDVEFIDYRKHPIPAEQLAQFNEVTEGAALINTRSTRFRELTDEQKQSLKSDTPDFAILTANPTLIKRPVIDMGDKVLVGFNESLYQQNLLES